MNSYEKYDLMVINIKTTWSLMILALLTLCACTQKQEEFTTIERTLVIEDYYPKDSIMSDVISIEKGGLSFQKRVEALSAIYSADSAISILHSNETSTELNKNTTLEIGEIMTFQTGKYSLELRPYILIRNTSIGELDDFGIFASMLGTIYYRGYDSHRIIELRKAKSKDLDWLDETTIEELHAFVKANVLPAYRNDEELIPESDELNDEVELQL